MKYLSRVTVTTIALLALGVAVPTGDAIGQTAKDLVGVWTPVSVQAFGPNPKGLLIFESNGRFSLQLMKAELPKYAANNRNEGTAEENKATVQGVISYYGTYSVNGTDLIFHVEACSFPNWTGTDQKRNNLAITGDELKYTNPAPSVGGPPAPLVWKRAK
jgi:Lipocalin-like domain